MFKSLREHSQLVGRLQQILRVLAHHGFYQIVKRLSLHYQLTLPDRLRYARLHQEEDRNAAIHLRRVCEELGPSFVEFGQLLSTRPDLIPEVFAKELSLLLTHTQPEPWESIQQVLPEEFLGQDTPFQEIHSTPLASASIAQIHRATLKDGTEVILKIQRPGIDRLIASDLTILRFLAPLVEKYFPESRALNPVGMVEEFAVSINQELDFILEATYIDRFSRLFANEPRILAPKVYWELSTPKVLVMEYIAGIPLYEVPFRDRDTLQQANINPKEVAHHLLRTFLKQIFLYGFFHADPHPGNFLVLSDNRIAFVDFGLMGQISQDERQTLAELFQATLREDYERIANLWLKIAHTSTALDMTAFRRGLEKILWRQMSQPYERIQVGEIFLQMVQNGARHGLKLPRELFLLFRTMSEIESLLRLLYPKLNVVAHCREFAQEQEAAAREPARLVQAAGEELQYWAEAVQRLPREVEEIINKLATDRFSIEFVHRGLEVLIGELDRSSNRLAVGLIVAALIIGSSLMILAGVGPLMWGLPLFGLTVFIIGCILGLFLVVLVLRSGKY